MSCVRKLWSSSTYGDHMQSERSSISMSTSDPADGYLSGSKRIGSWWGVRHHSYVMVHRTECRWVDRVSYRIVDVWAHPDLDAPYTINKVTLARGPVRFCQTCEKALGVPCIAS